MMTGRVKLLITLKLIVHYDITNHDGSHSRGWYIPSYPPRDASHWAYQKQSGRWCTRVRAVLAERGSRPDHCTEEEALQWLADRATQGVCG